MADTSYYREVEAHVRAKLKDEFGQPFTSQLLTLHPGGRHEFDAVSADRTVVASIKSASGLTAGGKNPDGKIKNCLAELYYLSLVDASTRRLVLTTPAFFSIFTSRTMGAIADGIDVVCVPLPPEMQAKVALVVQKASREVTPAAAATIVAAEMETELEDADHAAPN